VFWQIVRFKSRHMEREVRYCTTEDGVRIADTVTGQGPPLVYVPPPVITTLQGVRASNSLTVAGRVASSLGSFRADTCKK